MRQAGLPALSNSQVQCRAWRDEKRPGPMNTIGVFIGRIRNSSATYANFRGDMAS